MSPPLRTYLDRAPAARRRSWPERAASTACLLTLALATAVSWAEPPSEVISEPAATPPPPVCQGQGCAKVLSIRFQGQEWVPVAGEDGPGTYVGAADGIAVGTATAPIFIGEAALDKDEAMWTVTVRFQNGAMETIAQNYPPLFQRGDWVLVEGNAIRFAE